MIKAVVILAIVACASAQFDHRIDDLGTVGAQSEQTVRGLGFGGLSTISHQSKAVDSAFSSVRKHDTRVINPAVRAFAAPQYAYPQVAAPVYAHQPAVYAQPQYAYPQVAAPAVYAHQPAVYAPAVAKVAAPVHYAAPIAHAPVATYAHAPVYANAPVAATTGSLLGVKYSSVPVAAHLNFDGFGVHYGY